MKKEFFEPLADRDTEIPVLGSLPGTTSPADAAFSLDRLLEEWRGVFRACY